MYPKECNLKWNNIQSHLRKKYHVSQPTGQWRYVWLMAMRQGRGPRGNWVNKSFLCASVIVEAHVITRSPWERQIDTNKWMTCLVYKSKENTKNGILKWPTMSSFVPFDTCQNDFQETLCEIYFLLDFNASGCWMLHRGWSPNLLVMSFKRNINPLSWKQLFSIRWHYKLRRPSPWWHTHYPYHTIYLLQ